MTIMELARSDLQTLDLCASVVPLAGLKDGIAVEYTRLAPLTSMPHGSRSRYLDAAHGRAEREISHRSQTTIMASLQNGTASGVRLP